MYLKAGGALLLAVMFGQARSTEASHAAASQRMSDSYAQAAKLIDIGHGRFLNLRCSGSGPQTVLLEAGAIADSSAWFKVQPLLAAHARVCAYDRAGFGFSSEGPLPRDLDADVSDLHALIQRAGLATPLVMVGHSLGSNIVRQYASRYPADVSAMVLLDPPAQDIGRFAPGWQKDEDSLSVQRFAFLRRCEAAAEKHELTSTHKELSQCLGEPDPHASAKLNAVNLALMSKPAYWRTMLSVLQSNAAVFKPPVSKQETHGATPLIVLSAATPTPMRCRVTAKGWKKPGPTRKRRSSPPLRVARWYAFWIARMTSRSISRTRWPRRSCGRWGWRSTYRSKAASQERCQRQCKTGGQGRLFKLSAL